MTRLLLNTFLFLCVLLSSLLYSQTPEPILFGTYLPSSDHPQITYHRFDDTNLVKLGFNTIIQTVMHPIIHDTLFKTEPLKWHDNRAALGSSSFSNIVAMNSHWNKEDDTQVDWVKILTHGAYNKWEVEGGSLFESDSLKMVADENHTESFVEGDISGIKTKSSEPHQSDDTLISGPGMYQDPNYKVEDRTDGNQITYFADFRMKIGTIPSEVMDVCKLRVRLHYPIFFGGVTTWDDKILSEVSLRSNNLTTEFSSARVNYTIFVELPTTELEPEYIIDTERSVILISQAKIFYEVIIPANVDPNLFGHLCVDYIEVSEPDIWGENGNPTRIEQRLGDYHTIWTSDDHESVYAEKI